MSVVFTEAQSAEYTGMSRAYFRKDRMAGATIPYLKLGRAVRYLKSDLDAFLQARRVEPTRAAS